MTRTERNKKKKKFLKGITAFILCLFVVTGVTYTYFNNTYVFTFGTQKNLPIYRVDTEDKKVAITFDVNWGEDRTKDILEILDKYNAKATFFLIGKWIDLNEKNINFVKEFNEKGHEIGNHSNLHPDFTNLSREKIIQELEITDSKIYNLINKKNKLFRFPKGEYDQRSVEIVKSLGYIPIQWDVDSIDWKEEGAQIEYDRVVKKIKPGSIILFHNNTKYTPENLDKILNKFQSEGYEFVRVSELIYHENYEIDITGMQKKLKI